MLTTPSRQAVCPSRETRVCDVALVLCAALLLLVVRPGKLRAAEVPVTGHHDSVRVSAPTRLDFVFPLANQSPAEASEGWLNDYDSTQQRYELFVPPAYDASRAWPVVLFISAGNQAGGFRAWRQVCEKHGVIFAAPHNAGNATDIRQRVRIVLDVLDDVRRKYRTDIDRTYASGFSGGGRIACLLAFALPEQFGGVVPLCAAGDLREEAWLRHRVIDRLSVALVTGENDFNRGEVERFRGPLLRDVGVRTRIQTQPGLGHGLPSAVTLDDVFVWLEQGVPVRRKLARQFPATRAAADDAGLLRTAQAAALHSEASSLLADEKTLYRGLMQLQGIMHRWPDLPEARTARTTLLKYDEDEDGTWRDDDVAEQRTFLIARARAIDAYASGSLPKTYQAQRPAMLRAAVALWQQVLADGQDPEAVRQARQRIPLLTDQLKDLPE